mmetsp:Transcript_43057/g.116159  ORF Transcript_43057/g.116159 Transcript_43057/m.116159 type:complete len:282 (+) Transcript_43057:647-1492(+)
MMNWMVKPTSRTCEIPDMVSSTLRFESGKGLHSAKRLPRNASTSTPIETQSALRASELAISAKIHCVTVIAAKSMAATRSEMALPEMAQPQQCHVLLARPPTFSAMLEGRLETEWRARLRSSSFIMLSRIMSSWIMPLDSRINELRTTSCVSRSFAPVGVTAKMYTSRSQVSSAPVAPITMMLHTIRVETPSACVLLTLGMLMIMIDSTSVVVERARSETTWSSAAHMLVLMPHVSASSAPSPPSADTPSSSPSCGAPNELYVSRVIMSKVSPPSAKPSTM